MATSTALPGVRTIHSMAQPGTSILELMILVRLGTRMAAPPCHPPPGPGRAGHATTVANGKRPLHCAAAASCQ
eukprot:8938590-Heterocapsa_arctica.AAC.1